ncbi:MAG: MBL fold metallo-hydrolase [Candidatus Lokiarchaeota archaeon]|nr:MBL fold metallo-hydrolase [Candidatus Lokiarchaeota archaeon]
MVRKVSDGMSKFFGWFPAATFENNTCIFASNFANTCAFDTKDGLVIFDVPIRQFGQKTFDEIRKITTKPVKYIIFSHGHFDHAFGYKPFLEEIRKKGWDMPEVIAHENCVRRFEKYEILDKYHDWINKQQFSSVFKGEEDSVVSAHEILDPTILLKDNQSFYSFKLGGVNFEIFHDRGETDDSIWLWVPEKKTICAGDLMISSFPNVGNPFKVQRYPKDWALAMERMRDKEAEYLVPGHGRLIEGSENVRDVLSITAEVLHFVHEEVVKRLNEGKWFEQIYHEMLDIYPEKFKKHKILRDTYGSYRFAIHAVYRLYHGWYDSGNPTDLFPSKTVDIARELLKLNSETKYLEHANSLFSEGKLQLVLHILDIIIIGTDERNVEVLNEALKLKLIILKIKIKAEPAFIANNILDNGAHQIKARLKRLQNSI